MPSTSATPRYRLLQARLPDDVVRIEEHRSFATRLGVPLDRVVPHNLITESGQLESIVDGFAGILVGGSGSYSVLDGHDWVHGFIDLLGAIADSRTPMFASCFGFQGLVLALGGVVAPEESRSEVGTYRIALTPEGHADPVFSSLPDEFDAQQGHKDSAVQLPSGVVHLARSERCQFQAIRVRGALIYATQFHPELSGADNQARFMRYYEMYKTVFNEERANEILHGHRDSPESNALLSCFARTLANEQEN